MIVALSFYDLPLRRVRKTHRRHTYFVLIIIINLDHCHVLDLHFLYNYLYSKLAKLSLLKSPRKSWAIKLVWSLHGMEFFSKT